MKRKLLCLILLSCLFLTACGGKDMSKGELENIKYEETEEVTNYVKIVTNKNKVMLIELYPDVAPITVENFKNLVSKNYYDGTIFHRVIADFVVQAGGFDEDKALEEVDTIKGEFAANGVENNLKHEEGVVSMARANAMDSASNQFFICVNDEPNLDGMYAAFGKVIAGYDTAVEISKVETDIYDEPVDIQQIKTIRFVNIEKK